MFERLFIDLGVENPQQIDQKAIQKAIENKMEVGMDFGWLLDRFLVDFGPKLGSSWGQVGTKIKGNGVPRRCQKIIKNLETRGYAVVRNEIWSSPLRVLQY